MQAVMENGAKLEKYGERDETFGKGQTLSVECTMSVGGCDAISTATGGASGRLVKRRASLLSSINEITQFGLVNDLLGPVIAKSLPEADSFASLLPTATIQTRYAPRCDKSWGRYVEELKQSTIHHLEIDFGELPCASKSHLLDISHFLKEDSNLQRLTIGLSETPDLNSHLKSLLSVIKGNTTLQALTIAQGRLPGDLRKALADSLGDNCTLTQFDLSGSCHDSMVLCGVADALETNRALVDVNLGNTNIFIASHRNECCKSIAQALRVNNILKRLDLSNARLGFGSGQAVCIAEALSKNKTLEFLGLKRNELDARFGQAIASSLHVNSTLRYLTLEDNYISGEGSCAVARMLKANKSLVRLDLSWNTLGSIGGELIAKALRFNGTLERLDLGNSSLCDSAGIALAQSLRVNSTLRHLNLCLALTSRGGEAIALALGENKGLHHLDLGKNFLSCGPALAASLQRNTSLKHLELRNNYGLRLVNSDLVRALTANRTLQYLGLRETGIHGEGAIHLARILKANDSLVGLDLGSNYFEGDGCVLIAQALQTNRTLEYLSLKECKISVEGFQSMCKSIEISSTLRHVDLCATLGKDVNCAQRKRVARSMAIALQANKTLKHLDLGKNRLESNCHAIVAALVYNTTLQHLGLYSNRIGESKEAGQDKSFRLADALVKNRGLKFLDLRMNRLQNGHISALCRALEENWSLNEIKLYGNQCDSKIWRRALINNTYTFINMRSKPVGLGDLNRYFGNDSELESEEDDDEVAY